MLFHKEYEFLSNFYNAPITVKIKGVKYTYKCSEALYQALKSNDPIDWHNFQGYNGGKSKRKGKEVVIRDDWEDIKLKVMLWVVSNKFKQNKELARMLCDIDVDIVEHNEWHDNFYGDCYCPRCKDIRGSNHLGNILTFVRASLKSVDK